MSSDTPDIIDLALQEDIGAGDLTAACFTRPGTQARAKIVARQQGCLAGAEVAAEVFRRVDASLQTTLKKRDGEMFASGDEVLLVAGPAASILTAERTALNFIQRLSGVATLARKYVDTVRGTGAQILDTRKTTPGLRKLEKAAVAAGGARNHRLGLHDMFMVKDNHLATGIDASALQAMIDRARLQHPGVRVELEADTLDQAARFFQLRGVDVVMLDNMPLETMREAVKLCPPGIVLEASGGVTLATLRAIAETGVHFISVGALTHSAPAVDFGLDFEPQPPVGR
jgi:nicotinate-nucleotide pyrophosphorylase (carboxylating)